MSDAPRLPLLHHDVRARSVFTPDALMESVRQLRGIAGAPLPDVCVLEFDGDLTDWLVAEGRARKVEHWACFHTAMYLVDCAGVEIGVIARTIGGPYTVLIAEQLHAAGVRVTVGLTSAGRIAPALPLPCLVVAAAAVRDEGTSTHYLAPSEAVAGTPGVIGLLERELLTTGWTVRTGRVWTTDAPYRETEAAIAQWSAEGVLAVEMQAASLFAFGQARGAAVAVVAMVSNAVDHSGDQFDTGTQTDGWAILQAIARAGTDYLAGTDGK